MKIGDAGEKFLEKHFNVDDIGQQMQDNTTAMIPRVLEQLKATKPQPN